jgi:hypothetical protein
MTKQCAKFEVPAGTSVFPTYLEALNASNLPFINRDRCEALDGLGSTEQDTNRSDEPGSCLAPSRGWAASNNLYHFAALPVALLTALLLMAGAFAALSRECKIGSRSWCVVLSESTALTSASR